MDDTLQPGLLYAYWAAPDNRHRFSWYVHKNHHYTIALGTKRPIIEGPKGLGGRIIGLILLRLFF
jgi:hypothetical protein